MPHLPCLNARDAFAASFNRLSEELGLGPELFSGVATFWRVPIEECFKECFKIIGYQLLDDMASKTHRCKLFMNYLLNEVTKWSDLATLT